MYANPDVFSPWCQKCLDGDKRDSMFGSHARHVEEMRRERAAHLAKLPWRWKLADDGDQAAERQT